MLTFNQAQDGAMHIHVIPSTESSKNCYPIYKRSVLPAPMMPVSCSCPAGGAAAHCGCAALRGPS